MFRGTRVFPLQLPQQQAVIYGVDRVAVQNEVVNIAL